MTIRDLGWPALVAMSCALATAATIVTRNFELIMGFYPVQLLGMGCLTLAVWQTRRLWLFIFALPMILPLGMWAMLFYQCARGFCL